MAGLAWSSAVGSLDYPLYPGGPYAYALFHFREPMFMLGQIPFAITTWLADGFMLYRCYIVYAMLPQVWLILAIPLLTYFASIGTAISIIVLSMAPNSNLFKLVDLTVANAGLTAGLNILLTALISGRLISHSLRMRRAMGEDAESVKLYTSIWTMLVESCAIYSAFSLMFMVTYAVDHPSGKLFLSVLGQIQVIAPMLVALRLSREMARLPEGGGHLSNIAGGTMKFENPPTSQGNATSSGRTFSTFSTTATPRRMPEEIPLRRLSALTSTQDQLDRTSSQSSHNLWGERAKESSVPM